MNAILWLVIFLALAIALLIQSRTAFTPVPASHIRSFGLSYLTLIALVIACMTTAWHTGLDEVGLLTLGFGLWFLFSTLSNSWFLWNHPLTLWWRDLLGDRMARLLYVACGMGFVAIGALDINKGLNDVRVCRDLYAQATNAHERVRALSHVPSQARSGIQNPMGLSTKTLTCEAYRERGAF